MIFIFLDIIFKIFLYLLENKKYIILNFLKYFCLTNFENNLIWDNHVVKIVVRKKIKN